MDIRVGILVEILPGANGDKLNTGEVDPNTGHIGKVLRGCPIWIGSWEVEGALDSRGAQCSYRSKYLRPIPPDDKPCGQSFEEVIQCIKSKEVAT